MSVTKQITIWCDECSHWEQRSGTVAAKVRAELKKQGWVYHKGKDLCSECAKPGSDAWKQWARK